MPKGRDIFQVPRQHACFSHLFGYPPPDGGIALPIYLNPHNIRMLVSHHSHYAIQVLNDGWLITVQAFSAAMSGGSAHLGCCNPVKHLCSDGDPPTSCGSTSCSTCSQAAG